MLRPSFTQTSRDQTVPTNTVGSGPFTALSQTQSWIDNRQAAFRDHGLAWYALRLCESGELIGNCGMLRGRSTCVEPELGYMISLAHQGRGYATEAATATMHECALSSFSRVWATIRPANIASRRIAERRCRFSLGYAARVCGSEAWPTPNLCGGCRRPSRVLSQRGHVGYPPRMA